MELRQNREGEGGDLAKREGSGDVVIPGCGVWRNWEKKRGCDEIRKGTGGVAK